MRSLQRFLPQSTAFALVAYAFVLGATPAFAQSITISAPLVFDPKLDDGAGGRATVPISVTSSGGTGDFAATFTVTDASGNTVRTIASGLQHDIGDSWTVTWDGNSDAGSAVAPGAYIFKVTSSGAITKGTQAPVTVVRLGATALQFLDTGSGGTRIPLTYHATNGTARSYFAIDSGGPQWTLPASSVASGALDDSNGNPLAAPSPWTDLGTPPVDSNGVVLALGRSFPIAYQQGATLSVQVTLGDTAVTADGNGHPAGYPIQGVPIRMSIGGATPSSAIAPATPIVLKSLPIQSGLSKTTLTLPLEFEYEDASGTWQSIPGQQTTTFNLYTLLGPSQSADVANSPSTDARQTSFVAAVDEAVSWTSGTTQSAPAIATITQHVNGQKGLTYDVVSGASAYADGDPGTPALAFSEFLSGESRGNTVNCADCAALVGAYSRSIGINVGTVILGNDFPLNYILGIGATKWTQAVFTNGTAAFSFHAVASVDNGTSIHDACLEVDNGPHPDRVETRVGVLPIAMPLAHYTSKLSPGTVTIQSTGRPTQN